ncbi:membrane protein [Actinorhabdospora filicis]|uniref:Membrane protein n=2 Tax=Actinorhabdospora filicis TaxID=1785913 RepID=A0A9W6W4T3_9ACTN|nr:membrane protein [Actinorhabdospora filicis]
METSAPQRKRAAAVLVVALLALLASAVYGAGALDAFDLSRFASPGAESGRAGEVLWEEFGTGAPNVVLLARAADGDVDSVDSVAAGRALTAELAGYPGVVGVRSYWTDGAPTLRGEGGASALVLAHVPGDATEVRARVLPGLTEAFSREGGALAVDVGGSDELFRQAAGLARGDFLTAEAIVLPGLLVLLLLLYRRTVAALLTLGVGVLSVVATLALLRVVAGFTEVSTFAANLTLVMGIGLAVDYCLFVMTRFREESAAGASIEDAVRAATARAGRTVLFSAGTVAVSLSVLLLFPFPFLRSFAYAGILVPVTAGLGAVMVLPAALRLWGRRVVRATTQSTGEGRWHRVVTGVMRRPVLTGGLALVVVLLLASPFLGVRFGVPDERALPAGAPARVVTESIGEAFDVEESDALQVVTTAMEPGDDLAAYAAALSMVDGVAQVDSAAGRFVAGARVGEGDPGRAHGASTWLSVVPGSERLDADGPGLVAEVRAVGAPFAVLVGGYPAELADFRDAMLDRLPLVLLLILAATVLILFLMTGSVLIPVKATVLNLLSLAVMFGALVWVFQDGHLAGVIGFTPQGSFEPSIPILMFCVAYGLSMDYEVFLLSRIKEEWDRTGDNIAAVARGVQRSAPLVTMAAAILALTFAVYATGDVVFLQMLGVGMALAVLVDATLIRGVLMPALMRLTGRANWWAPGPLRRLHARIGLRE